MLSLSRNERLNVGITTDMCIGSVNCRRNLDGAANHFHARSIGAMDLSQRFATHKNSRRGVTVQANRKGNLRVISYSDRPQKDRVATHLYTVTQLRSILSRTVQSVPQRPTDGEVEECQVPASPSLESHTSRVRQTTTGSDAT